MDTQTSASSWNKGASGPNARAGLCRKEPPVAAGNRHGKITLQVSAAAKGSVRLLLVLGSLQVFNGVCCDMLPTGEWFWS